MVNIEGLQAKITDSGMTVTAICKKTGILRQTLYNRFKKPNFTIIEVKALADVLHLTDSEVRDIFFV